MPKFANGHRGLRAVAADERGSRRTAPHRHAAGSALALLGALALFGVEPAWALDNDPSLSRLCEGYNPNGLQPCGAKPKPDQSAFADLAREYAMALANKLLAPAETLGINGFDLGIQFGLTNINEDKAYWQQGIEDQSPPSMLVSTHIDMRKGLPYSVEVGATASYLFNSELFAFGGMVKFAPNEAIKDFPVDLAIKASVMRVVGSPQLKLTTFGLDGVISRSFGVAGAVNIAPYMAYSPVFVFARSGVIDSTPGDSKAADEHFVFDGEDFVIHRFVLGTRFLFGAFNFTPELALAQGIQSYAFNVGVDF